MRLPPGWEVHQDASGLDYFFNVDTGESRWEHPNASREVHLEDDKNLVVHREVILEDEDSLVVHRRELTTREMHTRHSH